MTWPVLPSVRSSAHKCWTAAVLKRAINSLGMASSGPHSNGYSLIRKVIEVSGAGLDDRLPADGGEADGVGGARLGDALLAPTRIYVKPVLELLKSGHIDGLAHITGGGLTENIVRVLPGNLGLTIDTRSWRRPAVFNWLQQNGGIDEQDMLRTFNCGNRHGDAGKKGKRRGPDIGSGRP